MKTNLFFIANLNKLRTGRSFRILLPFFPKILGCCRPKIQSFLTVFTFGLSLARFWRDLETSGGGGFEPPNPSPLSARHCREQNIILAFQ